jgi:hypothetical protein
MQLLLLDTVAIQPYIFGSNRLSENIGASHLVALATGDWVRQALPSPHNLDAAGEIDPDRCIENDDTLRAELVYAGGGNAVVLLRDAEEARKLARQLSRRALCEAPGLQLVLLQAEFVWGDDNKTGGRAQDGVWRTGTAQERAVFFDSAAGRGRDAAVPLDRAGRDRLRTTHRRKRRRLPGFGRDPGQAGRC